MSSAIPALPVVVASLIGASVPSPIPKAPALLPALLPPAISRPGEELPKGPPWHTEYRSAKREALRHGRPVFVYFTKTY